MFSQEDDPIACLNKAMALLSAVAALRFPSTNNQLRTSSNRELATILRRRVMMQKQCSKGWQGESFGCRVTAQQVQRRQGQSYAGTGYKGEEHMARQCTQPKRLRNAAWFKEKSMLAEAHESGEILDVEQLAFLANPSIPDGQAAQTTIPNTTAFQTEDLDAYDSDCDDVSNAKAVLMANLSNYGSDVISEVPHFEPYHTDMDNQNVHAIQGFEQIPIVDFTDNEITSDSNIIRYSQYLQETQQAALQDTNLCAQQDSMILFVIEQIYEQMINHEKLALKRQIDSLEQNLSNQIKEKESLLQTFTVFKNKSKEKESKYMENQIDLEKKIKELDNIVYKVDQSAQTKAQRIKPTLYDGSVISSQHVVIPVIDDEETLILEELNRLSGDSVNVLFHNKNCLLSKLSGYKLHTLILINLLRHLSKLRLLRNFLSDNQNALEIPEHFEINDLKAQLQAKDTTICKLKEHIKSLRENNKEENVKHEMDEIETINIELEHSVAKLLSENERMFKLDLDPLAPRLLKNRDAHTDYLKYTQEQADILRGIVKQAKAKQPLDNVLDFVYKHAKRIQELLFYVRDTCPTVNKPRLKSFTSASRSQPIGTKRNDRISQTPSSNMKNKHAMLNVNSELICVKCKQCMFDANHDVCFLDFMNDVNVRSKSKSDKQSQQHNIWKPTGKVFTKVGYKWKPTGKFFTIVGNSCPLTRITPTKVVHLKETTSNLVETPKPEIKVYSRRPKQIKIVGSSKKAMIVESKIANNSEMFHLLLLLSMIEKHLLYSEFRRVDLLSGFRDTNLYTISLDDMLKTSLICLLSKASKTKSWLWHHWLSHLNFGTLNKLSKDGLVRGIPKLKFKKDHLCSACALGKSKKSSHQPKAEDTNQEKLYLLHMDLCGPMRVESIYGKKYILVIVDDYSRFTWVKFLRSGDEASEAIIKCIKNIQVRLNATVRNVRTDNGTEFDNQTLQEFYENVGISHQTSVARTPQ
ncbi:retrovirus-related pol polyprotein from transposon TNT 1-94 [Tanacetum coccineum]